MSSEEAKAYGAEAPRGLPAAYITGCYLSVLGRWPDPGGMETYVSFYSSSGDEQGVLDILIASPEAQESGRFPPPAHLLDLVIGRVLQSVVVGQNPVDAVSDELATQYRAGVPVVALVHQFALRQGGLRSRMSVIFAKRQLAALVMTQARLEKLQSDLDADREWAWRINRHTWNILEELQDRVGQCSGYCEALPSNR